MPNYCEFKMLIKGKKENVQTLITYMKADYHYKEGKSNCTEDQHLFRVFRADEIEDEIKEQNGIYQTMVEGYCAWSVYTCMFDGPHTYYRDMTADKLNVPAYELKSTHLLACTKELDLTVEIIALEEDSGYEHYIVESGVLTFEETYRASVNEDGEYIYDTEFQLA